MTEADRTGFETTIELGQRNGTRYVAAAAVDANNEVLGSTVVYDMQTGFPAVLLANITSVEEPPAPPPTTSVSSYGAIGGSVVAVAALGSILLWFWKRKSKQDDVEKPQYKPVSNED